MKVLNKHPAGPGTINETDELQQPRNIGRAEPSGWMKAYEHTVLIRAK